MKLKAEKRELKGKKVKQLREKGLVPAAIYGPKMDAENITVDSKELRDIFKKVGYNQFFDVEVEGGKKRKVLIKQISYHPTKDYFIDTSFYAVDEDSKISVEIPVRMVNEAPAIKQKLGFLVQQLDTITVYCLPKDVPAELTIDIAPLDVAGASVSVEDVDLGEGVELDSSMDSTTAVAYIATAQKEIEEDDEASSDDDESEEDGDKASDDDSSEDSSDESGEEKAE